MKITFLFTSMLILFLPALSIVYGEMEHIPSQMEHDSNKDLSDLLRDETPFFSNQKSGDFQESFVRKATQEPLNSIKIKTGTLVEITGKIDREFSTILVEGDLSIIDTGDSALRVQKIIIAPGGSLTIGNNQNPIESDKKVEIVFVKNNEGETGIFVFGKLWIHGNEVNPTFVGLESHAKKWDKRLVVDSELNNWKRDDVVIITSPGDHNCNEISRIAKIVNQDIFLQNQLDCYHIGISNTEKSISSHVALLSRNVIIWSEDIENRGSVNFFHGSTGYIKYAQFDKLGPKEVLGRYPIHFHHLKDSSRGMEVIGNSITNSDNRWITIHDSNGILVKNNVGYMSKGHGFFLEDGNEFDNVFEKNIGITSKDEVLRPEGHSSIFWTMNPMNSFRDNVAVNAKYWGFLFQIPNDKVDFPNTENQINLRTLPSSQFEGNIAYNNREGGIQIIRPGINDEETYSSEILISDFNAMGSMVNKERHFGILVSGSNITITNSSIINHKIGIHLGDNGNKVEDSIIRMERNFIPDSEISGIVIAGGNNLIENSEIQGYVSKNNNKASDISLDNNRKDGRLLSAKIINTTLLDPIPLFFGNPINEKSFLEIYGYNAPFSQSSKLPQNFILKKIGSDVIEERGEYNNLEFDAMIKLIPKTTPENQTMSNEEIDDYERSRSELIKRFKAKSIDWGENKLSDEELLDEIEILFESRLIEIRGLEYGFFKEMDFKIPTWIKKLVIFWANDSISDQEFTNAIKYVLESKITQRYSSYD